MTMLKDWAMVLPPVTALMPPGQPIGGASLWVLDPSEVSTYFPTTV